MAIENGFDNAISNAINTLLKAKTGIQNPTHHPENTALNQAFLLKKTNSIRK